MIYVLGGRGRLGRALVSAYGPDQAKVLDRTTYESWWQPGADTSISRFFERAPERSTVVVAAGLLDPALPAEEHLRVNLQLPSQVIAGASRVGVRVVTFGTVMERLVGQPNPYIASKTALGRVVAQRAADGVAVTHVQVHTLFGAGLPSPHMFLGQMWTALQHKRPFEMSPGRQLREYHHVDDDVAAIRVLLATSIGGVVALSHGAPCTLRDLALHVFESLGRSANLRLGARPEPPDDNYLTVLPRPDWLASVEFRPTLPAVAAYMQELLQTDASSQND